MSSVSPEIERQLEAIPGGGDPDRLLGAVVRHGLVGVVSDCCVRLGHNAPPSLWEIAPSLRMLALAQEAWVRSQLQAASEVASAFGERGIPIVFMKGLALAAGVYERPGLRSFGDIDVLVDRGSVDDARRIILSLGFARAPELPQSMEETWARYGAAAEVDLHWDLTEPDTLLGAIRLPVREIIARAQVLGGLCVPSWEDWLLMATVNFIRTERRSLILLLDIAKLSERIADWSVVVDRADAWGVRTVAWLALDLAGERFGTSVPASVMKELAPVGFRRRMLDGIVRRGSFWRRRGRFDLRSRILLPVVCFRSWREAVDGGLAWSRWAFRSKLGFQP